MKNKVLNKSELSKCFECNGYGLFCETPQGADWSTCPMCHSADYINKMYIENDKIDSKYDKFINDNNFTCFCEYCLTVFDTGCIHIFHGCTDSIYNGHLVSKWKNKVTGEIFEGMPVFDSIDEWADKYYDSVEILEWCCPGNGIACTRNGYYSKDKYPQYYNNCSLVKK